MVRLAVCMVSRVTVGVTQPAGQATAKIEPKSPPNLLTCDPVTPVSNIIYTLHIRTKQLPVNRLCFMPSRRPGVTLEGDVTWE